MTEYRIMTSDKEVADLYSGDKSYIIRGQRDAMKKGDIIKFQLVRDKREIYHQISRKTYEVTKVDDCYTAPIYKGWKLISIREVRA